MQKRVFVEPGRDVKQVNFDEIEYSDDSGGDVSVYSYPPSGSLFYIGTTTVWVVAGDETGNTAYCTFDVIVSGNVKSMIKSVVFSFWNYICIHRRAIQIVTRTTTAVYSHTL